MNLASLLRTTARQVPAKPGLLVPEGHAVTFGALNAEADLVARALQRIGVQAGERVAVAIPNIPHFAYAYFGILRAGAVAVPLNIMLTEKEMTAILRDAGAVAIIGDFESVDVATRAAERAKVAHIVSTQRWDELGVHGERSEDAPVRDDDLAMLAYTSGTTGEPKGAMLTHGNLLANLRQQMEIPGARVNDDDVVLMALPLFHIFGLNVTLGQVVMNGATGLIVERFEPLSTLRLIQDHKVTVLFGAPPMYSAWLDVPGVEQYDLSSIRLAISGAAPLPVEVLERFHSVFGIEIYEGYGLTETAPTVTSSRLEDHPRPGSVGKPVPGVEVRLVDEVGMDVEVGDPGEIVVRGPNVFKGYWQRPEENERAFMNGWFRTGDIAVEDEEGFLYLVDRKRDLIIVSGFNVYPAEVEAALLENPKIAEAAVIGVPHSYTGEAVKAYVVLAPGATVAEAELLADVGSRVARFKAPESIEIVDDLPHLLTGKVLRRALRT